MDSKEISEAVLAEYSYKRGVEDERKEWAKFLRPETIEITIRARGKNDEIDNIRTVATFDEAKQSNGDVIVYMLEETLRNIATKGKVIKDLLSQEKITNHQ